MNEIAKSPYSDSACKQSRARRLSRRGCISLNGRDLRDTFVCVAPAAASHPPSAHIWGPAVQGLTYIELMHTLLRSLSRVCVSGLRSYS